MFTSAIIALTVYVTSQAPEQPAGRELFRDTEFKNGFSLTAASHPAPKIEIGVLQTDKTPSPRPPDWRIAQWATRDLLQPGVCAPAANGAWVAENSTKRVEILRANAGVTQLSLEGRGIVEYAGHLRAPGEAWPHLLIEQAFDTPLRLDAQKRIRFALDFRVPFCKSAPELKLDRGLHTTQVSAYWTVHNLTPGNPDHRDMIWFGLPLFDARHDIPPPHYALDSGKDDATGKFICLLDGKRFWKGRTGDGEWRSLDADLTQLIRDALAITREHGYLKNTRLEDLAITSFNLGWEIPGPYDAKIEFRRLSMKAERD
ncbi:MAG: hypothetical protein HZB26_00440 [Candidatus Hydrogenedentes bacterium]|nr:hypothetical protein [Candidatus Hydrogenedentota bacterium]